MNIRVCIGDFTAEIEHPEELQLPENFRLFQCMDRTPEYYYKIQLVDQLPEITGQVLAQREDLVVLRNEIDISPVSKNIVEAIDEESEEKIEDAVGTRYLESRIIGVRGSAEYYAIYREISESSAEIYFLKSRLHESSIDTIFTSLLALERRTIAKNALILHCAYIRYRGEAILFSAPSETGKSTQADLWEKYRGSRTINGDKSLLQKVQGKWIARGWPICGSSEICHNEDTEIKAIVMLDQSPENHSCRLRPLHAFRKLYSQITVNSWNSESVSQVMDLIEDLQNSIPVYQLDCNISEEAVACLENMIYTTG